MKIQPLKLTRTINGIYVVYTSKLRCAAERPL
jgi:hypothetical protein